MLNRLPGNPQVRRYLPVQMQTLDIRSRIYSSWCGDLERLPTCQAQGDRAEEWTAHDKAPYPWNFRVQAYR